MDPLTSTVPAPGVRFEWPPGFHELPVTGDPSVRERQLDRLLTALLPDGLHDVRAAARAHYLRLADFQAGQGIAAAALCNGRIGDRVTGAYISVSLGPLDFPDAEVAALGIRRILAGDGRDPTTEPDAAGGVLRDGTYVVAVQLPAGPAVATTDVRTVTAPGPDGQPVSTTAGVLQIHLPAPGHRSLLVITLMTPFLDDFTAYCQDGAALATSVRFTAPGQPTKPTEPPAPPPAAGPLDRPSGLLGAAALGTRGPAGPPPPPAPSTPEEEDTAR